MTYVQAPPPISILPFLSFLGEGIHLHAVAALQENGDAESGSVADVSHELVATSNKYVVKIWSLPVSLRCEWRSSDLEMTAIPWSLLYLTLDTAQ